MPSKIVQKHAKSSIKSAPKPANKNANVESLDSTTLAQESSTQESSLKNANEYITKQEKTQIDNKTTLTTKPKMALDFVNTSASGDEAKQHNATAKNIIRNNIATKSNDKSIEKKRPKNETQKIHTKSTIFTDREDAFLKLYDRFANQHIESSQNIILSTSFDGLFFAHNLAHKLDSKLDLLFSAPIFAPMNDECEIASVSENMDIVLNEELIESFDITLDYVYGEARRTYEEVILPRIYKFRKGSTLSDLSQKDVFLIDQGVESGITMSLAIKTCIQKGAKSIFILTPIIAHDVAKLLESQSDMLICVAKIDYFVNTRHYYEELGNLSEEEVLNIMSAHTTNTTKATNIAK